MSSSAGQHAAPLVLGLGARRGLDAEHLHHRIDMVLDAIGIEPEAVHVLATLQARAAEPGIQAVVLRRRWHLVSFPSARLAQVAVPTPSATVRRASGTPSVAEAAALLAAAELGQHGWCGVELVIAKQTAVEVTIAVASSDP